MVGYARGELRALFQVQWPREPTLYPWGRSEASQQYTGDGPICREHPSPPVP